MGDKIQHPRSYGELPKRTKREYLNPNDVPNGLPSKANVLKVWVDHNQIENEIKGMQVHVKFRVNNFKGKQGTVNAYFFKENGNPLKDSNRDYYTTSGNVSTWGNFQLGYVNAIYNDYTLFIPNKELHLYGKHNLKFRIQIFDTSTGDALSPSSDWVSFTYTGPEAHVRKVWVDHNQYQDSVKGMRIHVKFEVNNFKGATGTVNAYFYQKDGDPLKDTNGSYYTTSGNVSTWGNNFQPSYVNATYNDYTLFMPYSELHLRGKHNLKFYIRIFGQDAGNALSDVSDWVSFTYTGPEAHV